MFPVMRLAARILGCTQDKSPSIKRRNPLIFLTLPLTLRFIGSKYLFNEKKISHFVKGFYKWLGEVFRSLCSYVYVVLYSRYWKRWKQKAQIRDNCQTLKVRQVLSRHETFTFHCSKLHSYLNQKLWFCTIRQIGLPKIASENRWLSNVTPSLPLP